MAVWKDFRLRMKKQVDTLLKYRFLLQDLVVRDFKLKYRASILGTLWCLLNPFLMMLITSAVFSNMFSSDIPNYAVYYLCGYLIFCFVIESTNGALNSIVQSGYLIKKVYIPKWIFPLEKCTFSLINALLTMVALFIIVLLTGCPIRSTFLLVIVPIFYSYVFSLGFGMILATLYTFFRDIAYMYSIFTTLWMYMTPLFYPTSILKGIISNVVKLNPLYYYVEHVRELILYGNTPSIKLNLIEIAFAMCFLVVGVVFFYKYKDRFVLYL